MYSNFKDRGAMSISYAIENKIKNEFPKIKYILSQHSKSSQCMSLSVTGNIENVVFFYYYNFMLSCLVATTEKNPQSIFIVITFKVAVARNLVELFIKCAFIPLCNKFIEKIASFGKFFCMSLQQQCF